MKLTRISETPILEPVEDHPWEKGAVFNAGLVYHNGLFHMIYRSTDVGPHERFGKYISSLGYAVSRDLLTWQRLPEPVLTNDVPQEARGPEDPRIVRIEDTFYMVYCGYGGRYQSDIRLCLARSRDMRHWERRGVILDEPNKNGSLFPERINGKFCLLHRRLPDIWICYSDDLKNWTEHQKIMSPQPDSWDAVRIGIGGPPIRIDQGWFLIYHGVDRHRHYRLGAVLLEAENPSKVLARYPDPIIEPELDWEVNGFVPNIIFSCATVRKNETIYCVYGSADSVIGGAYIAVEDVIFHRQNRE